MEKYMSGKVPGVVDQILWSATKATRKIFFQGNGDYGMAEL